MANSSYTTIDGGWTFEVVILRCVHPKGDWTHCFVTDSGDRKSYWCVIIIIQISTLLWLMVIVIIHRAFTYFGSIFNEIFMKIYWCWWEFFGLNCQQNLQVHWVIVFSCFGPFGFGVWHQVSWREFYIHIHLD